MRRKIIVIILVINMCLASVILYNYDGNIIAESGGEENYNGSIAIENDFVWGRVQDFCNVTYDANWTEEKENNIPKGRAWATAGEDYTIENILLTYMPNSSYCGLTGVTTLPIEYVDVYPSINYSSKIVVNDFQLTIYNDTNEPYINNYNPQIPKTEVYPLPMAWTHYKGYGFNHNLSFDNASIVNLTEFFEDKGFPYPFAGTFTGYSLNITYDALNFQDQITVGIPIYIESNGSIPEEQDGMLFIIDEEEGCEEKINNITNATGCVLIYDNSRGYTFQNATYYSFPVIRTNYSDNYENVTNLIEMLENGTLMIADNYLQNGYMTFTYNFSENNCCIPDNDWFFIKYNRAPSVSGNAYNDIGDLRSWSGVVWYLYDFITYYLAGPLGDYCLGFILYDYTNTHFMTYAVRDWSWFGEGFINQWSNNPPLPIYSINNSVGEWLNDHVENTRISGYMDQEYKQQTPDAPGVESYNVVGYRNTTISPDDNITILSNRMDGFWGQTPGDSGVGGAIVLGIAKYMNDYNITPKYNLTFLFTTGEEYGMRGAQHYYDTHPINEYNFNRWIGTDQLGFNQNNTTLNICYKDETSCDILSAIANQTDYDNRTNYTVNVSGDGGDGTEKYVWKQRDGCDAISFGKEGNWDMYHRAGENYTAGDVLTNIDREDVNISFELVWNVTKYFTVNPDCWFESYSETSLDSPEDEDILNDSIKANFTVKSILPNDLVMVNATLKNSSNVTINQTFMNFTVNRTGVQESVTLTVPDYLPADNYTLFLELYNSTGRINEIVGIGNNNYNDTTPNPSYTFLYPFGVPPIITNVSSNPDIVGFGFNVTISADVADNQSGVETVIVNMTYPDSTTGNYTMNSTGNDTYQYVFSDTWLVGQYNYTIWAVDNMGNSNSSTGHSFNVSAQATISVCTIKDSYDDNETVNLTDPPGDPSLIGYELLDDGKVLRIWNNYDSYYFNTTSGIQLTNHYNKYWSHNVLMLGYYNNNQWNLIYRTDELSGFNKNIDTDNETYVNATLWKDLTYQGYDFRLAIRYHLGVVDKELTVIPYIKNLGISIPYNLGFAWEIKDIQVNMTPGGDYLEINGTTYYLNQSLDETYKNMDQSCFYIREDISSDRSESLYLCWNDSLDYLVKVKSRTGQYNAPVTLGIKIGTLAVGQEKYTSLFWHDTSEITYYFNSYNIGEAWAANPGYMVDDSTSTYASTTLGGDVELCNGNNCSGLYFGEIIKVELRVYGYYTGTQRDIRLRPVFDGTTDGLNYSFSTGSSPAWSRWFDITTDSFFTPPWNWTKVDNLDCDVEAKSGYGAFTLYCSKVETRVTYIPGSNSVISNPYPADGSTGIPIAPVLNITVSDPDGDSMSITWLSNSSGSWQVFGTNNSVGNGTYHQTMVNASVNGLWWYWKVNVTDGAASVESSVYKFYTGYESEIENTGSTNISGYLLIQVQYYNASSEVWVVDNDTVNESSPRTIKWNCPTGPAEQNILALDTIFNGLVKTSDLTHGNGLYRVYAAFRDPDGNVLVTDDETPLEAWYEFNVNF